MLGNKFRLALLDMNEGRANQSIRCLREIFASYAAEITYDEYDVRVTNEVPDTSYDIYICSGGPGNPLEGNGIWDKRFFELIDALWEHNQTSNHKKYIFLICHSFQMVCAHFKLGEVCKRKSTSFGVYPVHKTKIAKYDSLFDGLDEPFYVVDSRDYQLIQPNLHVFDDRNASILCLEKIRTHVELERAIMAVRFSPEMVGTQFHPEADPDGMLLYFEQEEVREKIIKNFGEEKFNSMTTHLYDPEKIAKTHFTILPTFLDNALSQLMKRKTELQLV